MGHSDLEVHESEDSGIPDEQIQEIVDSPENDFDSKEEFEEEYGTLEVPEVEFTYSEEEWVETHDITLDDELFE